MLNEADLVQRYPDLLGDEVEPELVRLVGQLDEASATYRTIEPPAALVAAIDQLASDRLADQPRHPRILVPRGFAAANPPPVRSERTAGKLRDALSNRPRWLRQSAQMAAGILALALFTGLFVTLLSLYGSGQLSNSTSSAKPVAPFSVLNRDPDVRQAYETGLGRQLHLVQSAGDFTVTLEWAYAQGNWIDIYYTISYPVDQKLTNVELWKPEVTASDGSILPSRGGSVIGNSMGTISALLKFDASELKATSGIVVLHFQSPGIFALFQGTSSGPSASTPSVGPADFPASGCQPNQRLCPFSVPVPFSFDFTVPYQPEPFASPPAGIPVTLAKAMKQVRAFLGEPDAKLAGQYVDTATADAKDNIFFPARPNAKLWVVTRNWKNGADPDMFIVDADTGEVLKAAIPSRASDDAARQSINNAQAATIAESFAHTHFPGFGQMTRADNNPAITGAQYLLSLNETHVTPSPMLFTWELRQTSGAGIPTFLSIGVDAKTGAVVQYLAHSAGDQPEPGQPLITREQAIGIALAEARKEPQNSGASISKITLQIARANDDEGLFTWSVELAGAKPAPPIPSVRPPGETISGYNIDARTGKIGQFRLRVDNGSSAPDASTAPPP